MVPLVYVRWQEDRCSARSRELHTNLMLVRSSNTRLARVVGLLNCVLIGLHVTSSNEITMTSSQVPSEGCNVSSRCHYITTIQILASSQLRYCSQSKVRKLSWYQGTRFGWTIITIYLAFSLNIYNLHLCKMQKRILLL